MITKPLRQRHTTTDPDEEESWTLRLTVLVAVVGLIWMNRGFMKPLAMSALFAATLDPLARKLTARVPRRSTRAAILTVGFAVTFLLPIGVVAFLAADAGLKRVKDLPEDWTGKLQIDHWLEPIMGYLPFDRADVLRVLEQGSTAVGKTILSTLQGLVADLPKLTIDNIVIILGLYVFLHEAPGILRWLRRVSPLSVDKTQVLFDEIGTLSASTNLATLVSGLVQSGIICLTCLIMGTHGTLLITMTAFVLSFIPVLGTAPVSLYLIGASALTSDWTGVVVFSIMAVVAGLSDNFVRPYVLSGSAKLHPLVAFVAAFGALETMGFYGLFLGPVVAGAVFTLVELVLQKDTRRIKA